MRWLVLTIVPFPYEFEATDPERLKELQSSSFGTGPSWEDVDSADWYPWGDGKTEVANLVRLASVESITEEQYRRFSEVHFPPSDGGYGGFSGQEMPSLDWIKLCFGDDIAAVGYQRYKKSAAGVSSER